MSREPPNTKTTVYYDGKCPMCRAVVDSVGNSTRSAEFFLRDVHQKGRLPFSKQAIENEMHVVDREGRIYKGAEAILKIAEGFPHLRWPVRFARAPVIKSVAPVGYQLVAGNRRFLVGSASPLFWLKITVVVAFCIGLLMSRHLWIGDRSYPLVPISSGLPQLGGLLAHILFAALFLLAGAIFLAPKPQRFIAAFLAIIAVFCLLDETRWQPWVLLYGFLLATLALFSWDSDDVSGQQSALNIARLILASTYVFSGLQKINTNFVQSDFPWIVQPITNVLPSTTSAFHALGMVVPFVQIAFGVGLLTKRFRRASLIVAIAMHLFILAMFGPTGHNWNNIIWPWTAAMAVFDILLFTYTDEFDIGAALWTPRRPYHGIVLVVFAALPLLSFFNAWDSYLSAALYSGNLTEAEIYITDAGKASLPVPIQDRIVHVSADTNVINLQRWAIEDLNVTPYPETRVYKAVARSVCSQSRDQTQLVLVIREQRMFRSKSETGYRCSEV
jgi:predicted DCC family thiol-disulfide oxidoreductase YuxK/uncharacterized membrane protein YphA (DoxX/SURF4 family)